MIEMKKLQKESVEDMYPLSPVQEGMLFHYLNHPGSKLYFEQLVLDLDGHVDSALFRKAWQLVAESNEMLRTVFRWDKLSAPIQIVLKECFLSIKEHDLSSEREDERERLLQSILEEDRANPIDISSEPFRIILCKLEVGHYQMIITNHHIILDGWSNGILLKEFFRFYGQLRTGQEFRIITKNKYKQFIEWHRQQDSMEQKKFWDSYLKGFDTKNLLPKRSRFSKKVTDPHSYPLTLPNEFKERMAQTVRELKTTSATLLYTAWGILLQRYSNTWDAVLGTTVSGRSASVEGVDNMVGLFINTPPLRVKTELNDSVQDLLKRVEAGIYEREQYESTSIVDIKACSEVGIQESLFDSILVIENYPLEKTMMKSEDGLRVTDYSIFEQTNFDLTVEIELFDEIRLTFSYMSDLFDEAMIQRMSMHYVNILEQMIWNYNLPITQIDLLTKEEEKQLSIEFNSTTADYPNFAMIHELFENQVKKTPDHVAAVYGNSRVTYRQLNERSNQLARKLRSMGVGRDSIVALMAERSLTMITAIMAIVKAGGAYLPIDPEYPQDRIQFILEDSGAKMLLTQKHLVERHTLNIQMINADDPKWYEGEYSNLERMGSSEDLAYVIYTSGSTGKPKGAMIAHYSLVNRINWMQKQYPINESDVIMQKTPFTFDVSVWEMFWWTVNGASVCFLEPSGEKDPHAIIKCIHQHNVSTMHFVPSMLNSFLDYVQVMNEVEMISSLKRVFCSGEALGVSQAKKFNDYLHETMQVELINLYGPTEATIDVSYYNCSADNRMELIPIGKPIDNIQLYILDQVGKLQPVGIMGELCIAGDGLARGYLNRTELTSEKFVDNPFVSGKKMYKTGDLARWLPDGNIEYLGRMDHQVKIRGVRIELGEIEKQLTVYPAIKEAVVVPKTDESGSTYLCAYFTADNDVLITDIKKHLAANLPSYSIPSFIVRLKHLPLSSNGKLDRKVLPDPDTTSTIATEYTPPSTMLEEKLVAIWQQVLNIQQVGIDYNFFEMGGHSLRATSVVSRIHKETDVKIPLSYIFEYPTIRELASMIEQLDTSRYIELQPVGIRDHYSVSSAQKRLYILNQLENGSMNYNMSGTVVIQGRLDREHLQTALQRLIQRHEALRTSFLVKNGEIVQEVHPDAEFQLEHVKMHDFEIPKVMQQFVKPFDLSQAPLIRCRLIESESEKYVLLLDMHHIISDGVSMNILIQDFIDIYKGNELPELAIQYKDYSVWQNTMIESKAFLNQEKYWLDTFKGGVPTLELPLDRVRPTSQSFEGDSFTFELKARDAEAILSLANKTGTTLYMVLLAAYHLLLSKYSGQDDIIIGSPVAGRHHAGTDRILGMFVNTLPMRNHARAELTFGQFLQQVKQQSLLAFENQDYPFELLVEKTVQTREISRNPLFDTMFVLQNTENITIDLDGLSFQLYDYESNISKFDLTLSAQEEKGSILFRFEYGINLFNRPTVERMAQHFLNLLQNIPTSLNQRLAEMKIMSFSEEKQVLFDFNNTRSVYPKDKTLGQLFEEQVERTPDQCAIIHENYQLTYRELNDKVNILSCELRSRGVGREDIVAVLAERTPEMIIGILAIVKSGGAYMPIDSQYPEHRIQYMIEDSRSVLLLTTNKQPLDIGYSGEWLDISRENERLWNSEADPVVGTNMSSDLAYIIYTSGSTGRPKGTMIEHRSVIRLVKNTNYITFEAGDKILQTGSLVFDASTFEVWGALLNGLQLCLVDEDVILSSRKLHEAIVALEINMMWLTAPLFNQLSSAKPEMFETLKYLLIGGDVLSPAHIQAVKNECKNVTIINGYGPTENTTFTTCFSIESYVKGPIPIGRPISNTSVYIVDKNQMPCPIGVPGELYIGGDGLARGYLNNPELNEEKFISIPLEQSGELTDIKVYRSGDRGRWLVDGNIEFMGRMDTQVKIRGYLVEIPEIEKRILNYEGVKAVVVVPKGSETNKQLCAYLTADTTVKTTVIREFLSLELPSYMIPAYFVVMDTLPLKVSGKIDIDALPEIEENLIMQGRYKAPSNDVEEKLISIWQELLGFEEIGVTHNFFECGGHSLNATLLMAQIHKEFEVEMPLRELFKSPTIEQLAEYIAASTKLNQYVPIEPLEKAAYYAASAGQTRLYVLSQLDGVGVSYNVPAAFIVKGNLDHTRVERVIQQLVQRHELLRTSFEMVYGKVVQIVHEKVDFRVERLETKEEYIEETLRRFIRPFNVHSAPLIKAGIANIREDRHLLLFDMHHMITDGTSMGILIEEFIQLYEGIELSPCRIQYKDFAYWQNMLLESDRIQQQEQYWLDTYAGEIPVLNLPTDYVRPAMQSFQGKRFSFELDRMLSDRLNIFVRQTGATLYMVLLASFNVLLHKYTSQEDIIVGSPIAGRSHANVKSMLGMFVNTLAMRSKPCGEKTFLNFLREVEETTLTALENADYPFEQLVEKLNIPRDKGRNPLFDVLFVLQNMNMKKLEVKGLQFEPLRVDHQAVKFDLALNVEENEGVVQFLLEYSTKLFRDETMERFSKHFICILEQIVDHSELKIAEIELLSSDEREQLLFGFNNTEAEFPKDIMIHELFKEQAERIPERIAVVFGDESLTYQELHERSNQLARLLRDNGIGRDDVVALIAERSIEMIVAIMAIVKAGGAYLPIDPHYPLERIQFMLEDSNSKILLTQEIWMAQFSACHLKVMSLNDSTLYQGDSSNLVRVGTSQDPAYIIYTSGSTGQPKGVIIEHQALVNRILWQQKKYPIGEQDIIMQKTPFTFDVSVWEMFWWAITGAQVCFLQPGGEKDPAAIIECIDHHQITTMHFVPSMLGIFLEEIERPETVNKLTSLRQVFTSGEALSGKQAIKFNELLRDSIGVKLINLYGPTEAAIDVTYFDCSMRDDLENVPIGKPIDNIQIYIVDAEDKLKPIGVPGELCIGGTGLARGYLNRAELTAEKFVLNPYVPGSRMYKTGDMAKWLPDGEIAYLGRLDDQVKIRGIRIELEEIERKLVQHPQIKEAVVVARSRAGNPYLCAYFTVSSEVTISELRTYLLKKLPDYMVPSFMLQLENIPLSLNGKVDRKALPVLDKEVVTQTPYIAPSTLLEIKIVEIWNQIMGPGHAIGACDNFFEIGGNSLSAAAVVSKVRKQLRVEIPLSEMFNSPTVKQLAEYIESQKRVSYNPIQSAEFRDYYPVSSAQKRLYMMCQFNGVDTSYNMPVALSLKGILNMTSLKEAVQKLIDRHEGLRTTFDIVDDQIVQRIHTDVVSSIDILTDSGRHIHEIQRAFVRPFDLSEAPLLRVGLVKIADNEHMLLMDMHHIISDGLSMNILIQEFCSLYQGLLLPEIGIQYKDYAVWQNSSEYKEAIAEQREYWLELFSRDIPVLDMQTEGVRPAIQSYNGASIDLQLDQQLSLSLKRFATDNGATLHMLMMSAFYVLLYKYTGQEEFVIGTPIAGRDQEELKNTVGMFVNMLPLRNKVSGGQTFNQLLQECKLTALAAYDNQNYSFDDLVEQLHLQRDLSRNPLFDVVFALQSITQDVFSMGEDLKLNFHNFESRTAKYDLSMDILEQPDVVSISIEYCTDLFSKTMIGNLAKHYVNILKEIVERSEIKIQELNMLTIEETSRILHEFNRTERSYDREQTLHALFEKRSLLNPLEISLVYGDVKISYDQLNKRANQVAHILKDKGIARNDIVGILAGRSIDIIVAILAVLKAGAAYMPIDPDYPEERKNYMLKDSRAKLLMTTGITMAPDDYNGAVINLDDESLYKGVSHNLENVNEAQDLAYIMYTSGSTGNPKGVMITHQSVHNLSMYYHEMFDLSLHRNIVHMANVSFDASIVEIFPPLIYGATIFILEKDQALDRRAFLHFVKENSIQIAQFVPVTLKELLSYDEKPESLDIVIVAGDKLDDTLKLDILSKGYQLTNHYGPTEATVDSIVAICNPWSTTIGKPIANTRVYILDKDNNISPIGVPGELCIAGDGLARGYLNNQELTAKKFSDNPISPGEVIYRTGDLGTWTSDGDIIFLGRQDNQIKLRGYRVEPGEIEEKLLKYVGINEVVVIDRIDKTGSKYLCAYVISDGELDLKAIKRYLSKELPEYMIPTRFMRIEEFPLTSNGKVNSKVLPEPENLQSLSIEYTAPVNETQKILVQMWEQVLDVTGIGIHHNFFELGGHSLKATILISKIHKELNTVVPLAKLFRHPTIQELTTFIQAAEYNPHISIQSAEIMPYYPVSSSQKRIYIMWKMNEHSTAYNMPSGMILEGEMDILKFENAVKKLVERHEILRTLFDLNDGEPVQIVQSHVDTDIQFLKGTEEELRERALHFIKPFDLTAAPLFRAALITFEENRHLMLFDVHHIVSDGISLSIMLQEFASLYGGIELDDPKLHYKDYAVWHNLLMQSEEIKASRKYWIDSLRDFVYTELPAARASVGQRPKGIVKQMVIDSEWIGHVNKFCHKHEITRSVFILGVFQMALLRVMDRSELTLGVTVAGRRREETEYMPGVFLNLMLISSSLHHAETFIDYLHQLQNKLMEGQEHQDYPYESLYADAKELLNFRYESLFSILFNYLPLKDAEVWSFEGFNVQPFTFDELEPKYGLTLYAAETEDSITLDYLFNNSIDESMMLNLTEGFKTVLEVVVEQNEIPISRVFLSPKESPNVFLEEFDDAFDNDDFF
ncbi:amino acid adenylation domain-containing protein [Paenibacillus polysaccharolyticus]|uniref:non-ribosomal peptide synthetase n=1 Tax=Paenibacillus polysaccharolyticus TaxID=582692 RepID=UPI00209DD3E1|nr:non-ribosomal peptide synthetase [Paenibacillus polysaccharolyticus]MCP1135854.1 amino acid adenylation domain-containing protein [Paenibacillus polysaccharolyticus]